MAADRCCFLSYDIPDSSEARNPSWALRRLGVRVNLSVWVIPEHAVPWDLLNGLTLGGAAWHLVRFDASEGEKLLVMASKALRREVEQAERSAARSLERAGDTLHDDAQDPDADPDVLLAAYRRRAGAALRRARRMMDAAEDAAKVFGLEAGGLAGGYAAVQSLQAAAHVRAAAFAAMLAQAKGTPQEATAAQMPPLVLADYLEEQGADTEAAREAFADVAV